MAPSPAAANMSINFRFLMHNLTSRGTRTLKLYQELIRSDTAVSLDTLNPLWITAESR